MTPSHTSPTAMSSPQTNLIIIGAGVVGSALAHTLSSNPSVSITVLSPPSHTTSTSLAPGLIGQLNALPALTILAKTSVKAYLTLPPGAFSAVGGLEIASTPEAISILEERLKLAHAAGLEAQLLSSDEAAKLAPQFVKPDELSKALYFPTDGVAEPTRIVDAFQSSALANGVTFLPTTALSIERQNGIVTGVTTPTGTLPASKVIVATGIWSPALLEDLLHVPVIPVAHPYLHGPSRAVREKGSPFVRWPEKGVYARDHGECDGFGTYEHVPVAVAAEESAKKEWDGRFDGAVGRALSLFPEETATEIQGEGARRLNGVFAVTPDGLPIAGAVRGVEGLWVAAAVWVTHAAGVAGVISRMVLGREEEGGDEELRKALDPGRFEGRGVEELKREALAKYNDIYNLEE